MKTTIKVITFGNCQADQLAKFLSALTPADTFSVQYYSNNDRTGGKKSAPEILDGVKNADILFYQPLSKAHGELSDENIQATVKPSCVALSFAYIFNSGISSLCNTPKPLYPFGKDYIIDLIEKKYSKAEILDAYREGEIDFKVSERFQECLSEQRRRETQTSLKLADFIADNYQEKKLFISQNHPTNTVFYEMLRQIKALTDIPVNTPFADANIKNLVRTNCPVSPHDAAAHNYQFEPDTDWFEKGSMLIERIIETYAERQESGNP